MRLVRSLVCLEYKHMKTSWPVKKLGEVLAQISDGNYSSKYPRSQDFIDNGVPFIRATNFKNGKLVWDDMRYISPEKHADLKKGHLKTNDILITTRGDIGTVAFVAPEFDDANINAQIVRLQVDPLKIMPLFLFYLLNSQYIKNQFYRITTGSTLKQLSVQNLHFLEVQVPPQPYQKRIVERLDAIRKAQELCEEQIQKTEELFESLILREIDTSRGNTTLKSIIKLSSGKFMPSKNHNPSGKIPVYGGNGVNGFTDMPLIKTPTIVIGRVGAYCGNVHITEFPSWISDNAIYVKEYKYHELDLQFLYYILKVLNLHKFAGISGQPKITQEPILNLKLNLPELIKQQEIVEKLEGVQNYKKLLTKQKELLKELFDSVLDKSMKGQLDN